MKEERKVAPAENPFKLLKLESTGVKKWATVLPAAMAALSAFFEEGVPARGIPALFIMARREDMIVSAAPVQILMMSVRPLGNFAKNGANHPMKISKE